MQDSDYKFQLWNRMWNMMEKGKKLWIQCLDFYLRKHPYSLAVYETINWTEVGNLSFLQKSYNGVHWQVQILTDNFISNYFIQNINNLLYLLHLYSWIIVHIWFFPKHVIFVIVTPQKYRWLIINSEKYSFCCRSISEFSHIEYQKIFYVRILA